MRQVPGTNLLSFSGFYWQGLLGVATHCGGSRPCAGGFAALEYRRWAIAERRPSWPKMATVAGRGRRKAKGRFPAGDGGTGALCRGQGATHGAGRSRRGPCGLRPSLHGRPIPYGWTAPPTWPTAHLSVARMLRRCGSVRRVKPAPGSQLALFATYSYHAFITDRDGDTLELEADHRRHAEIENAGPVGAQPSPLGPLLRQRRLAGRPGAGA